MREVLIHYRDAGGNTMARRVDLNRAMSELEQMRARGESIVSQRRMESMERPSEEFLAAEIERALSCRFWATDPTVRARVAAVAAVRAGAIAEIETGDLEHLAVLMVGSDRRSNCAAAARWLTGAEALMQDGRAVL